MTRPSSYHWLYIDENGHQTHAVGDHREAVEVNPHFFGMDLHDVEVVKSITCDVEQQRDLLLEAAMNASWVKVTVNGCTSPESGCSYLSIGFCSEVISEQVLWKALIWFGRHLGLTHRDVFLLWDATTETCGRRLFGDIRAAFASPSGPHTTGHAPGEL